MSKLHSNGRDHSDILNMLGEEKAINQQLNSILWSKNIHMNAKKKKNIPLNPLSKVTLYTVLKLGLCQKSRNIEQEQWK